MTGADEVASAALIPPFEFNFYGQTYSQIWLSSNGFGSFTHPGGTGCCDGPQLPASSWP